MRPEDFVVGMERSRRLRGFLQEREEQFEEGESEAYNEQIAEVRVPDRSHHDDVLAAVRQIFSDRDRRPLSFDDFDLSIQERSALESLRSAHAGKDARTNLFIFAEQRREMLEQALAALQPVLTLGVHEVPEFQEAYNDLVKQVGDLRERLANLEDAQDDEMLHYVKAAAKGEEEDDGDGDKDDDEGDEGDEGGDGEGAGDGEDAAPRRSTVYQPDEPDEPTREDREAKAPTSKGGVFSRIGRALGLGGDKDDDK